jgi:hypothetical protein
MMFDHDTARSCSPSGLREINRVRGSAAKKWTKIQSHSTSGWFSAKTSTHQELNTEASYYHFGLLTDRCGARLREAKWRMLAILLGVSENHSHDIPGFLALPLNACSGIRDLPGKWALPGKGDL